MSEVRGLGRETLWYGVSMLGGGLLALAQIYVFSRLLDPAEYGVFFLVLSIGMLVNFLGFSWINQTIKRYLERYSGDDRARFLGRVIALYCIVLVLLVVLAAAAAPLLPLLGIPAVLAWATLSMSVGNGVVTCVQWFYTVRRQAADYAVNQILLNIGRLGLGWLLLLRVERSGEMLVWAISLAGLLAGIAGMLRLREAVSFGRHSFDRAPLQQMFAYGWPLGLSNAGGWLLNMSGRVILAPLAGLYSAGVYSAAHQFAQQVTLLALLPVVTAADPLAIRVYEREGAAAASRFLSMLLGILVLLGAGVCLCLTLLAQPLASAVLDQRYSAASGLFVWFAPAMMLAVLTPILIKSQEIGEHVRELPWLMLGAGVVNIGLSFLLIPRWGALGAAVALLAASVVLAPVSYWRGQVHLRWAMPRRLFALTFCGLLALLLVHMLLPPPSGLLGVSLTFTAYMLGYLGLCAAAMFGLRGLFQRELAFLRQVVSRRAALEPAPVTRAV